MNQDKDPSKGPTGRCGHLKTKHKTQYATIKAPRKRKLRGEDDEDTMEKFTRNSCRFKKHLRCAMRMCTSS